MFELSLVIALALAFDFINGFHDTANAIATSIATRVLSPAQAITMAAVLNFTGAMVSTGVAWTIGHGIINPHLIDNRVISAGLIGAISWNLITWYGGLPSSSSHALIGGLAGAATAAKGLVALNARGLVEKIFLPLITSPLVGFGAAYIVMGLILFLVGYASPRRLNSCFARLQVLSAAFMAFSHGANDAQKSMGIITAALLAGGEISSFRVPCLVIIACAAAMALGTSLGGWRIIRTVGSRIIKLEPIHGFAAEATAAMVIITASLLGSPVSTTHVLSAAVMGVGATRRVTAVRWNVAGRMVQAWLLTAPAAALVAGAVYTLLGVI
ncbi:inorganic phosphate transporter [Moorella sp. Hama-1]|uniref:inorganic phosphate transporter n=1 Tax=Moorella sp. Hama-1 TaxID=2138101 RepID=UPI000D657572|nr:inorganic phosphate transporter [Moorella sp. Hama-1]MDN5362183.1 inorganic phosphate transporter, PiT family [Moorella sp. (in: firmicutes)]BCV21368.1 inorganic phosphate transporter [Moorella sp. Hama-1]